MGGTGATRRTARGASKIHLLRTAACALAVGLGTGCALMPGFGTQQVRLRNRHLSQARF